MPLSWGQFILIYGSVWCGDPFVDEKESDPLISFSLFQSAFHLSLCICLFLLQLGNDLNIAIHMMVTICIRFCH